VTVREPGPGDFTSSAPYYDRYRPSYPAAFYRYLAERFGGRERMVELGCGTGRVILGLAEHFESALGVEPNAAMRAVAEGRARSLGLGGCSFVGAPAEQVALGDESVDLCLMCQAFHWMDRELVLERVHPALKPGGGLVVADPGPGHPLELEPLSSVMVAYAGKGRRPGGRSFGEDMETHEALIERSAFGGPERVVIEGEPHSYDADDMIGLLYSTSYCSPEVIGERRERFERDVREGFAECAGGDERLSCRQDVVLLVCERPK
jgi:ubiquinone/menaquinone biosynthesis C-methylase UbiE